MLEELIQEIRNWMNEAGERIIEGLKKPNLVVETKADRKDLVTDLDKATQDFLVSKITAYDREAKILGEENGKDHVSDMQGRVYIIDPIDGTMNFVLEQENFCIMVGVYEDGIGKLGFIYNVMSDDFLWGGPDIGVFLNGVVVDTPADLALEQGLVGMNSPMLIQNQHHEEEMGQRALGVRMTGCAGIELMSIALGKRAGYVSNLSPWDYAPGGVLLETLGLKMGNIKGKPLAFDGRELFIAGTPSAFDELVNIANS